MKIHININLVRWNNIYLYLFLSLCFLLSCKNELAAQSISFSSLNGPYGGNLGDVAITSDGEIFISAYYSPSRGIYKSTDDGLSWRDIRPSEIDARSREALYCRHRPGGSRAVGHAGQAVLRS